MGHRIEPGKRAALGVFAALALLALIPASAGAVASHPALPFSPITGAGTGVTFYALSGIGVEEESGNVFLDNGDNPATQGTLESEVDVFGPEGGAPAGLLAPYKAVSPSEYLNFGGDFSGAAVDNSPASPARGTLYVADGHGEVGEVGNSNPSGRVERFTLNPGTGRYELAGELVPQEPYENPEDVAVDAKGNVFVVEFGNEGKQTSFLYEFSPAGAQLASVNLYPLLKFPNGLAVDAAGDVFVSSLITGAVYKLPAGELNPASAIEIVPPRPDAKPNTKFSGDVAVDTARNLLYVANAGPEGQIEQFDAGASEADPQPQLVFSAGAGVTGQSRIAVNSAAGRIYLTRPNAKDVAVLGYGAKLAGLAIGAASGVSATKATLNGAVNPDGEAVSECDFEYLPTAEFASETQKVSLAGASGGTFKLSFEGKETGAAGSGDTSFAKGSGKVVRVSGTANRSAGSTSLEVASGSGFAVGQTISGVGIPAATTIVALAGNILTLSQAATSSGGPSAVNAGNVTGALASEGAFAPGQALTGTGIPSNTTILALTAGTLTLSKVPTAAGAAVALTGTSKTVSNLKTSSGAWIAGEPISGAGIPAGATIAAVNEAAHTLELSAAATASGAGVALSANLPFNAGAATVQSALRALPSIGGERVSVSGTAAGPYTVEFQGALAETDVEALGAEASALTPAGASATVTTLKEGRGFADGASAPCEGPIPADEAEHKVSGSLSGLTPDTKYRYRLHAANANGSNHSVEGSFTTLGLAQTDPASAITSIGATLNGTVLPGGKALSECTFEYDTTEYKAGEGAHGTSVPCKEPAAAEIPEDDKEHKVKAEIKGLAPGTEYHFRLAIDGGYGAAEGADEHFETKPGKATPLTGSAKPIAGTKATLNGTVNPEGEALTECSFEYGPSEAYGNSAPCEAPSAGEVTGNAPVPVHTEIEHLVPNGAEYHFRLVVATASATSAGDDEHFKTADTVLTGAASEVGAHSMTLNGTINPEAVPLTECSFEYGTTTAYGQSAPCTAPGAGEVSGNSPVAVHAAISGLAVGTLYHYRLLATSADGTAKGADKSQKTLSPPTIEREWVASAGSDEATLKATVNPEGFPATAQVQYGTTTSYGQLTPVRAIGSDKQPHTLTFQLEGLDPGNVYHWRVVAESEIGEAEGADREFSTARAVATEVGCPNQALRLGPSARLPDCRAYEMVSPVDKNGGDIVELASLTLTTPSSLNQSAADGNGLAYGTYKAFGDAQAAPFNSEYVAARGPAGWASHSVSPPATTPLTGLLGRTLPEFFLFSPDLCQSWVRTFAEPPLAPGALVGYFNLYRHSDAGCGGPGYEALTTVEPKVAAGYGGSLEVQGVAAGGDAAFYAASGRLTDDAPDLEAGLTPSEKKGSFERGAQLYVQSGGQLRFVCYLPDATPSPTGCRAGGFPPQIPGQGYVAALHNAVSRDGERLFWTAYDEKTANTLGTLYLRVHPSREQSALEGGSGPCSDPQKACTIDVSRPVEEETGTRGARFWAAAEDGSRVIFTVGAGLYEAEIEEEAGHLVSHAHLIAGGVPLNGQLGASEDARRVYFASSEVLTSEPNPQGKSPSAGKANLYLYDANKSGAARFAFLGTLSSTDTLEPAAEEEQPSPLSLLPPGHSARVSPDGTRAAFTSSASLTGYDNTDQISGEADAEVYLYDATAEGGEGRLICPSCNPSGAAPLGANYPEEQAPGRVHRIDHFWAAALIPGARNQLYASHPLSADGRRLFFNSFDPLVPADTNGREDVYQWEAPGKGSCSEESAAYSPRNEGCISLISSGTSAANSEFLDADPEGENVFFTTLSGLLPQDPGLLDIYDARVEGGFPQPAPAAACEGEACQSPPEAPNDPTPASASFQGAGNVSEKAPSRRAPCPRGKVKRRGKCVAKNRKHNERKDRKHPRRHGRAAR